jgi:hypothetical protein
LRDPESMKLSMPRKTEILLSGNKLQQRAQSLLALELHTLLPFIKKNAIFMVVKMMITINLMTSGN